MLQPSTPKLVSPLPLDVRKHALFLDLDGTLVEFAARPEQVVASESLRQMLTKLARAMNGALALVTGRSITSADAVLDGALMYVAGLHGLEQREATGVRREVGDIARVRAAANDAQTLVANGALDADIEDKGAALAIHYRRAPQFANAVRHAAAELARRHSLILLEGKMVAELKLGERTKGDAVLDFMNASPFAGRTPIAVGDDITDEDAFRAVADIGGHAILVGAERPTSARWRLDDPHAVREWLAAGLLA
ncbi:MAG: trehalose-phosphatase [Hyphomonadaceae bacterium]